MSWFALMIRTYYKSLWIHVKCRDIILTGAGSRFIDPIVAFVLAVAPAIHGQAKCSLSVFARATELGDVARVHFRWRQERWRRRWSQGRYGRHQRERPEAQKRARNQGINQQPHGELTVGLLLLVSPLFIGHLIIVIKQLLNIILKTI